MSNFTAENPQNPQIPRSPLPPPNDPNCNLYCLKCGYNLRGLSGDPRRCPECGHHNPMSELTLPAGMIERELRRMETAPNVCIGTSLLLLPFGLSFAVLVVQGSWGEGLLCCSPVLIIAAIVWLAGAGTFKDSCQGHPLWLLTLAKLHVYGLTVLVPTVAAIIAVSLTFIGRRRGSFGTLLLLDGLALLAALLLARWARRKMRALMDPLQRQTAVRIAHKTIWLRMGGI